MRIRFREVLTVGMILALMPALSSAAQSKNALRSVKNPIAQEGVVQPAAIQALQAMSNYLRSANTLGITSQGSLDVVTNDGQRIQLDGTTTYKIRRPGFVIDYDSDMKTRRFIYDGKTFTIYSPKLGFYASAPAPATNQETLDTIYNKFGISLPLVDLFRWNEGMDASRVKGMTAAYDVGSATIDGVETEHYAFREPNVDWEVWIQQGDKPLPKKLVIVDRTDASRPTFIARLDWQVNPTFADSDFSFTPDANAKRIALATYKGMEK